MSVSTSIWDAALATVAAIKSYLGGDEKLDMPPSKSAIYDVRAADHNAIVAGLAEVALRCRAGMLVRFSFSHPNVTASGTAQSFYRDGGGDTARLVAVMPWAGSVVGVAVRVENARTAGTLTVNVEVAGTPITLEVTIDGTHAQNHYAVQLPAVAVTAGDVFAAGDTVEATWTTDAAWAAGATPTVDVDVYLAMGE